MICLRCDSEEFALKPNAIIEQEFKRVVLQVESPAYACVKCGWLTLDVPTLGELVNRTKLLYEEKMQKEREGKI